MRIACLHLRAYGHFTGHTLDFGPGPGLHLVYGDNETGKSTALRALSSTLFGYPHEVVDGFKHDARDIVLGADLVAAGGRRLSFVRRRRGKSALADAAGAPLDQSAIAALLGGVSRDVFEKVFALDHRRLHAHAQALLAEGGALGFGLAEAASGVAGLKAVLDRLGAERADLFLPGGSARRINQMIKKLTELHKEARRRTVSPHQYNKVETQIHELETAIEKARDGQKQIEADVRRLRRIEKNLPRRAEHEALSRKLDQLAAIPLLPPDAAEQRAEARTARDTAQRDYDAAVAEIERLEGEVAAVAPDPRILAHAEGIKAVAERRPVVAQAEKDLPRREAEFRQLLRGAADKLASAELPGEPENLERVLPSAVKRKMITTLAEQGTTFLVRRATAAEQLEQAGRDLNHAMARRERTPKPPDTGDLARVLEAANRLGDITADIDRRMRAALRGTQTLKQNITSLGIASGEVSDLRALVVPAEKTVDRYAGMLDTVDRDIASGETEAARLDGEIRALEEQIRALKTAAAAASDDDLAAARRARDQGWALVRGLYIDRSRELDEQARAFAPDGNVADAYERRVAEADRVADAIRAHAEDATRLSLFGRQEAEVAAKRAETSRRLDSVGDQREALLGEWRRLWPAGMFTPQPPGDMREWLARRASLLAEADEVGKARDEIDGLSQQRTQAVAALGGALGALDAPAREEDGPEGIDALRQRARQLLDQVADAGTQHETAKEAVRTQESHKANAEKALAGLVAHVGDWTAKWNEALAAAGLGAGLTIDAATTVLGIMNDLDGVKKDIDGIRRRIAAIERDREDFQREIAPLAPLVPDAPAGDPIAACQQLEQRLKAAEEAAARVKALKEQLDDRTKARDGAMETLNRSDAVLKSLCAQAECTDPAELPEVERRSAEKRQAARYRDELEKRIREDGAGLSLGEQFAECDGAVGDRIPGEIAARESKAAEAAKLIEETRSRRADVTAEFKHLVAEDQAADFAQQAACVEAEIAEAVEEYVDLTLEEALLRQAVDLYRDRNQGPILGRARGLFAGLTDGAYQGLRADVDERGQPILIAEHGTRGSLAVGALSDGTVDPLYLALRLAVVEEHNATREPLPFVADDLLVGLDNTRTQAAFRTLARIAATGQVLFFTHHAHMIELARSAVPAGLLVEHRLPDVAEAGGS